jgi:hypothetical protein
VSYIATLLRMHGLPDYEAAWRAQLISCAYMGWLDRVALAGASKRAVRDWTRRLVALALAPPTSRAPSRRGRARRTRTARPKRGR